MYVCVWHVSVASESPQTVDLELCEFYHKRKQYLVTFTVKVLQEVISCQDIPNKWKFQREKESFKASVYNSEVYRNHVTRILRSNCYTECLWYLHYSALWITVIHVYIYIWMCTYIYLHTQMCIFFKADCVLLCAVLCLHGLSIFYISRSSNSQ